MTRPGKAKQPRSGRRRLVIAGMGVISILVGLYILTNQAFVSSQLQPYVGSALGAGDAASAGLTPYGSLSYVVYAVGIGLIASGGGLLRMTFHSSVAGYMAGGSGMAAGGMTPEAMQGLMAAGMARMGGRTPSDSTTVKVKCRNCGSLEAEDATYCRKCGKPM